MFIRVLEEQDLVTKELEASISALEKLVEDRNKDENGQKVEQSIGGSGVRHEFQSSDMKFGCHSTPAEHDHINM